MAADIGLEWQDLKPRSVSDQPNFEEIAMSTSAVSSSSLYQQLQSYFQTRSSDVQQLGQALSSGNLAQSQVAYNNITALGQGGPFANGNPFRVSQREQDFTAIGQALQSGDLAGAQQAFSALLKTFRGQSAQPVSTGAAPTPVASPTTGPEVVINLSSGSTNAAASTAPASATSGPEIVLNLSSGSTNSGASTTPTSTSGPEIVLNLNDSNSTSPEQVTINIGNSSGGSGEQVSISVGNQGAEQVTLNLSANSNEEIILNLLSASPASAAISSATGGLNISA
jgi:hypothetical protein